MRILINQDVIFNKSDFDGKHKMKVSCSEKEATVNTDEVAPFDEATVNEVPRGGGRMKKASKEVEL